MPIRPLSSELQKVAERELNEVPDRVQEDLNHIREWLSKQPHIKARTDDQWLIAFLRGAKFSLERTKEKIETHYTIKTMMPEFYANRDPFLPEIQEILSQTLLAVVPNTVHPAGPRILTVRAEAADPDKITVVAVMKVVTMMVDILLLEDDNFNVVGGCGIVNVQNAPYKFLAQLTPDLIRKCALSAQEAFPTRVKGLHITNAPSFIMTLYHAFKMLLNEKNKNRVFFYDENNIEELQKTVPRSVLPKELGGETGSCVEIAAAWKKKVESYRDWFLEDVNYGTDETKRPGKPKTAENILGLQGSFRKLDLD